MDQNEFNPYVGPRPFERKEEDSKRFFGRSQETQEIVAFIFGHPITLVYAQSGAGKTSLFNASITPSLEKKGFDVLPLTRVGGTIPKGIALQEVENLYIFNALSKMDPDSDLREQLTKSLPEFLKLRAQATGESGQQHPRAIIFDQFEELFTYTPENWREQREGFFRQVVESLNADPLLRVVFVIREDFLAELDPYARDLPERLRIRYRLERLGENAALRAIKDPLASTSRKFAPGVAEGLVKQLLTTRSVDATGKTAEIEGQYVEPVQLQVVCVTLWSILEPECIEIQKSHLENFNVNDALSNFYKSAIESAAKETGEPEAELRNWFGKTLITPMGTRSTVFRGEESTGGITNITVDFLESRHIIRAEFRAGARWYELTHDRLVEPILASNQKWLETLSPFQRQAALWNDQGRSETWLFSDQALAQAQGWAKEHQDELTQIEKEFLKECQTKQKEKEQQQQARQSRLRRIITNVSIVVTIVTLALAAFGFAQAKQAKKNEKLAAAALLTSDSNAHTAQAASTQAIKNAATAQAASILAVFNEHLAFSRLLASQSNALQEKNFQLSMLLGVEAYNTYPSVEARGALLNAAQANPRLSQYLKGHSSTVSAVSFSPDGKTLASGSYDNTIILWDVETRQPIGQPLTASGVTSVAFSPDGKTLASGSYDNTIILWDVETSQPIGQPLTASGVTSVAFSPDGKTLASGSYDNTIILWDVYPVSWIKQACQRAGRNFTKLEWIQYFLVQEYRKTCDQWLDQWLLESELTATVTPTGNQVRTPTVSPTITPEAVTDTPMATPTFKASATPSVTSIPTPVLYRVINVTGNETLNIRSGPGIKYKVIAVIPNNGTGIQITGGGVQVDNAIWVPIIYNGKSGWVNSYYIAPSY
jgi:hypothetical protein